MSKISPCSVRSLEIQQKKTQVSHMYLCSVEAKNLGAGGWGHIQGCRERVWAPGEELVPVPQQGRTGKKTLHEIV